MSDASMPLTTNVLGSLTVGAANTVRNTQINEITVLRFVR